MSFYGCLWLDVTLYEGAPYMRQETWTLHIAKNGTLEHREKCLKYNLCSTKALGYFIFSQIYNLVWYIFNIVCCIFNRVSRMYDILSCRHTQRVATFCELCTC